MPHLPEFIPALGRRGDSPDAVAPDGSQIRFLIDASHGASHASVVEVTLPAGQVSRPVRHRTVEEVWYILEGSGQVWRCPQDAAPDEAPPVDVSPGDALVIPTGWSFQFAAGPGVALRFLCVTMPPWPGEDEAEAADFGALGPATV